VIALAPLPFVPTYLKVIAVWVLLLSAIAALAISLYFSAGSQLACIVVDGLRVPGRPKPERSLSLTPDIRAIRVGLCHLLNFRPYSPARSPAMAGEIQLSKFIPGSVPVSELLGGLGRAP
jgi:hypothetical protein